MATVDSLFAISKGHQLPLNAAEQVDDPSEGVAFVARSHRNNGITAWVRRVPGLEPAEPGTLSVCLRSRNHSLATFIQPKPYYSTYHVAVLTPRKEMTLQEKLWWGFCIRANRFRYGFGRQANRTLGSLILPDTIPEWAANIEIPSHGGNYEGSVAQPFDVSNWEPFALEEIFTVHTGRYAVKRDLKDGSTPLVTASEWNNGITGAIDATPDWSGGQITIASNGSIGAAFFQPRPFCASRDVTILEPRGPLSPAAAIFLCTIIRKEGLRYNYARKWTGRRMKDTVLRLPALDGTPDFAKMEKMILSLPLGWSLRAAQTV